MSTPRDSSPLSSPHPQPDSATILRSSSEDDKGGAQHRLLRLFTCPVCSSFLDNAVSLPCGRTVCRSCLPTPHLRSSVTYPSRPGRRLALSCPFADCPREHAVEDCGLDVVLNKTAQLVRTWLDSNTPNLQSHLGELPALTVRANLADGGALAERSSRASQHGNVARLLDALHAEMDCQVCYALFSDPLTTSCGHTFCRSCLHSILDQSQYCPVCRRQLSIGTLYGPHSFPSNGCLERIIAAFWDDESALRREALAAENATLHRRFGLPLLVFASAFPTMPTFLHIFEPRYRLMIRRVMEADNTFGMVFAKPSWSRGYVDFHEVGTLVRIVNAHYYQDGRCLIETIGLSRFRVVHHALLDGYAIGTTERVDDVGLEDEEAMEAAEVGYDVGPVPCTSGSPYERDQDQTPDRPPPWPWPHMPVTVADLSTMPTQRLIEFAVAFIAHMRGQGAPWLADQVLAMYGECPDDPAVLPWWFASMLPVRDAEKYRLLGTLTLRGRLKMCASWILDMEAKRS